MKIKLQPAHQFNINAGPFGYCLRPVAFPVLNGEDRHYIGVEDLQPVVWLRKNFLLSDSFNNEVEVENAWRNGFEVRGYVEEKFITALVDQLLEDNEAIQIE